MVAATPLSTTTTITTEITIIIIIIIIIRKITAARRGNITNDANVITPINYLFLDTTTSHFTRTALQKGDFEEIFGISVHAFKQIAQLRQEDVHDGKHIGRPREMSAEDEVAVLFLHMRHYVSHQLIARIIARPPPYAPWGRSTITEKINKMVDWFYSIAKPHINTETKQERSHDCFTYFGTIFTYIMDGTEQKIHSSRNIYHEGNFFSTKKGQHSITLLLIISPSGKILYISPCYYGSIVDNELVRRTRQDWQHAFRREGGAGDSGFRGLQDLGINLYTPLADHKSPLYSVFSHYRIKVENVIAQLKIFECLHQEIKERIDGQETYLLKKHYKRWVIAGALINLKIKNWVGL